MLSLFAAVSTYTTIGKDHSKSARFGIEWGAFSAARDCGDPAFGWPNWQPWEVLAVMRELVQVHNDDAGVQQYCAAQSRHGGGHA